MIIKALLAEFEHEAISTRKLLQAVPAKDITFKPAPISWSMGELAQHIATIYYWYVGTLTRDEYDMDADSFERGDTRDIGATLELFEKNVQLARQALSSINDDDLQRPWTMISGGKPVLGPMPRGVVARGFLFNHLYHHRGEMIVYLRATGNKVPGMYGPVYEEGMP